MENGEKIRKKIKDKIILEPLGQIKSATGIEKSLLEKERIEKEKNQKQKFENSKFDNKDNNKLINKILFQIQLYFSNGNLIDRNLAEILVSYLFEFHFKNILEERDSLGICGNILCNTQLNNTTNTNFDFKNQHFMKDTHLIKLFCNVKCYQKFKDFNKKIKLNSDYLKFTIASNLFALSKLRDYFKNDDHIEIISESAFRIMLSNRIEFNDEDQKKAISELENLFLKQEGESIEKKLGIIENIDNVYNGLDSIFDN